MATLAKPKLYEEDFYAWTQEQADLLRARRFGEIDLERLIEEVDDLGQAAYRSARARIRTIIEHLLKLEHSPARESRRGWIDTIITQRRELEDDLTPVLRPQITADFESFYGRARSDADKALRQFAEHAAANALPDRCPYTFAQLTGDWLPGDDPLP